MRGWAYYKYKSATYQRENGTNVQRNIKLGVQKADEHLAEFHASPTPVLSACSLIGKSAHKYRRYKAKHAMKLCNQPYSPLQ